MVTHTIRVRRFGVLLVRLFESRCRLDRMMDLAYQPSMLDTVAPELGRLTGGLVRHELDRGAWVDHLPGWVLGSDSVLSVLLQDVGWRAERRKMYDGVVDVPRLLRW